MDMAPLAFVPPEKSRLGGGDIVLSLTPEQADRLGADAPHLADWLHSVLWALDTLRAAGPDVGSVPVSGV